MSPMIIMGLIGLLCGVALGMALSAAMDEVGRRRWRRLPPATPAALKRDRRDNVLELRTAYSFVDRSATKLVPNRRRPPSDLAGRRDVETFDDGDTKP